MDDDADVSTSYKNLYKTKQLPPWKRNYRKNDALENINQNIGIEDVVNEHTIFITDDDAKYYTDTNRFGWRSRLDYAMLGYEDTKGRESAPLRAYLSDPNRLLECAITTIILIATKNPIPQTSYICTELYLKNIRDEFGDHPTNIDSFLKYLNFQKSIGNVKPYKKYKFDIPENLTVTKIHKKSKIPISIARSCSGNRTNKV